MFVGPTDDANNDIANAFRSRPHSVFIIVYVSVSYILYWGCEWIRRRWAVNTDMNTSVICIKTLHLMHSSSLSVALLQCFPPFHSSIFSALSFNRLAFSHCCWAHHKLFIPKRENLVLLYRFNVIEHKIPVSFADEGMLLHYIKYEPLNTLFGCIANLTLTATTRFFGLIITKKIKERSKLNVLIYVLKSHDKINKRSNIHDVFHRTQQIDSHISFFFMQNDKVNHFGGWFNEVLRIIL